MCAACKNTQPDAIDIKNNLCESTTPNELVLMMKNTIALRKSPVSFIPNILDYIRIALLIIAIFIFSIHPWIAIWLYVANSVLDMLDGTLARALNQQSQLGTLLDFSIDRASITILLASCVWAYPHLFSLFVAVVALDIASHFAICYASACKGGSHLHFISNGSALLALFSQKSIVRYFICTSHDIFFALFLLYFLTPSHYWLTLWILTSPGMLMKTWVHFEQFYLATKFAASC